LRFGWTGESVLPGDFGGVRLETGGFVDDAHLRDGRVVETGGSAGVPS